MWYGNCSSSMCDTPEDHSTTKTKRMDSPDHWRRGAGPTVKAGSAELRWTILTLLHQLFSFLLSAGSYRILKTHVSSLRNSIYPTAITTTPRRLIWQTEHLLYYYEINWEKISYVQVACQVKTWIFLNLLNNQLYYTSITTHPGYQQWCLHGDSGD